MRSIVTILSLFAIANTSLGQILEPVKWTFKTEKVSDTEYNLIYHAAIDDEWNVYSQHTSDDGPVPTAITYETTEGYNLAGDNTEAGHRKEGFDKLFETNVIKYLGDEDFTITQKVTVTNTSKPISGYLTFMTCNDKTCLPPTDVDFTFDLSATQNPSMPVATEPVAVEDADKSNIKITTTSSTSGITVKTSDDARPAASISMQSETATTSDEPKQGGMLEPVKWSFTSKTISDTEVDLIYKATIDDEWNVYSQHTSDDGPVPTAITYESLDGATLAGENTEAGHRKEGFDKLFETNVIKFLGDEDFTITQRVQLGSATKAIKGYLTFMTCNDKTCLPPTDVEFAFNYGATPSTGASNSGLAADANGKVDQRRASLAATYNAPLSDCGKDSDGTEDKQSLWWLLIAGILGGFAALMTPCVFPMIPITVSFFTKDNKRKGWMNGLIYGASIIAIYVTLGFIITYAFGAEALNALSTNWIANTIFFIIFIVFAFSFFGYYELTLPSSWTTKTDSMADKGGLLGIFFMAATLSLVSFSCTGPIVGSALVAAANGGFMGPLVVMLGFSGALALPFGLFAAFPSWLNSLPRSGGWMNSVKVVLGFLEVGFAFKFLSTADLTQHWGFLRYELFMLILILVAFAIAAYLFGFIKFPHDSPTFKLKPMRAGIASLFLALGVYLCFGFTLNKDTGIYNSLWLTSGFSPPVNYNYLLDKATVDDDIKAQYSSYTMCANNINCFKDYFEGLEYAKSVNKPVFVDFTGHGCQNCRRTEDNIWVDSEVRSMLNNEVVLVSLYVDDRKKLKAPFVSLADGKKKRTVGNQWADFQVVNFKQNSQPLYIMVTPDEQVITHPRGYEEGIASYNDYLRCGLAKYAEL